MAEGSEKQTSSTEYRSLCHELYSNTTIQERRKILTYFGVERKFVESNDIEDDTRYILKLEDKNIISAAHVNPLLECLQKLGMLRLAGIVQNYQSTISVEPVDEDSQEADSEEIAPFEHCEHLVGEETPLLCVTCRLNVCYECVFATHQDHDVFSEKDFEGEIRKYHIALEEDLQEVNRIIDSIDRVKVALEGNGRVVDVNNELATICLQFRDAMQLHFQIADRKRSEIINSKGNTIGKTETEVRYLSSLGRDILESIEGKGNVPDLNFLQRVNKFAYEISEGIKQAEIISENLKDLAINVRFCPSSLSANFVRIKFGPIVGAIRVNEHQLVLVIDQRNQDPPTIQLSCVSCENTTLTYWSHVIESDCLLGFGKKLPRIAACNMLLIAIPKVCILIGCGTNIFQVEIMVEKDSCSYNSFTVKDVCLPDGSEITCVSVILSHLLPAGVIITDSVSHSIMRLDRDLVFVDTLELVEKPHIAAGFMRDALTYAYSNGKEVKVVTGMSPKDIIRTFESPNSNNSLFPANMFHDFTDFIILWKTKETRAEKEMPYKVMAYRGNGNSVRLSCEGTCSLRNEAIGISFVKHHGLLCLANGKVVLYDTL